MAREEERQAAQQRAEHAESAARQKLAAATASARQVCVRASKLRWPSWRDMSHYAPNEHVSRPRNWRSEAHGWGYAFPPLIVKAYVGMVQEAAAALNDRISAAVEAAQAHAAAELDQERRR